MWKTSIQRHSYLLKKCTVCGILLNRIYFRVLKCCCALCARWSHQWFINWMPMDGFKCEMNCEHTLQIDDNYCYTSFHMIIYQSASIGIIWFIPCTKKYYFHRNKHKQMMPMDQLKCKKRCEQTFKIDKSSNHALFYTWNHPSASIDTDLWTKTRQQFSTITCGFYYLQY